MNAIKGFFARDGSVVYKEQSAVFQRSDLDNWIYAYLPLSQTQVLETLVRLNFERPDGVKPRTRHMSLTSGNPIVRDGVSYYEYSYPLTDYQLLRSGTLLCALSVKQSDSVLMSGTFGIEVGVSLENIPDSEVVDENELESIILVNNRQDVDIANLQEQSEHNEQLVRQAQNAANLAKISAQESEASAKEAAASAHAAQMEVADVKQSFADFTEQAERDRQSFETQITNRQNAYEMQVNERIGEFESDTTARVDELAQQIGERQGTTVDVGGAAANRIAFTIDPQTQIDEKSRVNVNGAQSPVVDFTSDPQAQIDNKVDYAKAQNLTFSQKRTACNNVGAYWVDSETAASETIGTQIFVQSGSNTVMRFGAVAFTTSPASAVLKIQSKSGTAMVYISNADSTITAQLVKTSGNIGDVYYLIVSSSVALYQQSRVGGVWVVESQVVGGARFDRGREIDSLPTGATLLGQAVGGMVSREVNIGAVECPSAQYTTIDYPGGFTMNADGFVAKYAVVSYCPMATYEDETESSVIMEISAANATRYPINYGGNGQDVGAAALQTYSASLIVYNYSTSPIYVKRITFYGGHTR